MKKTILLVLLINSCFAIAQSSATLPFIGSKSFSFCEGNACESYLTIEKNGNCKIHTEGFEGYTTIQYTGKYKAIIWIFEKGKKSYGYKVVGKNRIIQVDLNGKQLKNCFFDNQLCESYLYYRDKNGYVKY